MQHPWSQKGLERCSAAPLRTVAEPEKWYIDWVSQYGTNKSTVQGQKLGRFFFGGKNLKPSKNHLFNGFAWVVTSCHQFAPIRFSTKTCNRKIRSPILPVKNGATISSISGRFERLCGETQLIVHKVRCKFWCEKKNSWQDGSYEVGEFLRTPKKHPCDVCRFQKKRPFQGPEGPTGELILVSYIISMELVSYVSP